MSKHEMEIQSVTSPMSPADTAVQTQPPRCEALDAVPGNPARPRVIVTSLPENQEVREFLSGSLLAVARDHHEYIWESLLEGDDLDLQKELAQARAPEDLAYALLNRAMSVSLDAVWSLWVADELVRLAEDSDGYHDPANCNGARALAATIISCIENRDSRICVHTG